jgi:D-sedoheptulose 7-phosphate isomerase
MDYLQQLILRYPALSGIQGQIRKASEALIESFEKGGKLLIAGNGGSASDAEHIVGELMKGFLKKRPVPKDFAEKLERINDEIGAPLAEQLQSGLPAVALSCHTSLNTAIINDTAGWIAFAQQVYGYGMAGDVFLGITTSGNSKNIIAAAVCARAKGLTVISMTGDTGGGIKQYSDICINVPEKETWKIQELHLPVYHALCLFLEDHFFGR